MKCTRHRLPGGAEHLGDGRLQSLMCVGDDQLDAAQAAPGQTAQELGPERLGLAVADGHAEHFAPAIGVDGDSDDHRHRDYMMVTPGFDVGGIQPEIRPVALDRPAQEGLHPLVDLDTEPRDLRFADPFHAHRLDQLIHRAGRDALDISFLDHRGQRLLAHPAWFEEAGEVAAAAQLRDAEFDRAGPGLPVAIAIAVAMIGPALAALAVAGAAQGVGLQLHQALRGKADHLAQQCRVGTLLQKLAKGDLVVGHRGDLQG